MANKEATDEFIKANHHLPRGKDGILIKPTTAPTDGCATPYELSSGHAAQQQMNKHVTPFVPPTQG